MKDRSATLLTSVDGTPGTRSRTKRSTSTLTSGGRLVPWLAAAGPLAYSPEAPPARDSSFQYGWVLPEVLRPDSRSHFYFGALRRDHAKEIFAFWEDARRGKADRVALHHGGRTADAVAAPIAVYRHSDRLKKDHYVFIQHGSYQYIRSRTISPPGAVWISTMTRGPVRCGQLRTRASHSEIG